MSKDIVVRAGINELNALKNSKALHGIAQEDLKTLDNIFALGQGLVDRYDKRHFHGIMADTGAGGDFSVSIGQTKAYSRVFEPLKLDT